MPRRKKIIPVAEQIEAVNAEIETISAELKEKKAHLKELLEQQKKEQTQALLDAIHESGKDLSEILDFINSDN